MIFSCERELDKFVFLDGSQAFRYLREEVKVFQGKPIMVSSVTEMHPRDGSLFPLGCHSDSSMRRVKLSCRSLTV